jgi:two-component system NtrC family sensor kinase
LVIAKPKNMEKKERGQTAYYRSITRNIIVIILVVSLTPMFLVSGIILYQFQNSYREKIFDHLGELVEKHKQNIDGFLAEKLNDIRFLAGTFSFEELSDGSFLEDSLNTLQREFGPVFVDLGVVNERGIQIAYSGPFRLGRALYSDAEWFKKALQSEYFISDVFLGLRGLPHFIVAVKENWKGERWILRSTIDFVAFNTLVENIRIGQTGFAYIVNREGEFQTKPLVDAAKCLNGFKDLLTAEKADDQKTAMIRKCDETGVESLFVADFLKNGDWLLVYQQDAADAFSDLKRAIRTTILINVLGGLAILTMAIFLSKRVVRRIAEADQEKQVVDEQIVETGKLASIGELAAGIAHEINNPVAIMVEEAGWIGDLLEEDELKETQNLDEFKRALAQINTQGKRCKEITSKLLTFARKTDSRITEIQINELLEEMVSLSSQRAKYANVTITTDFEEGIPPIRVSQSELQQVFLNLINNSLDAMEKQGGTLRIKTGRHEDGIIVEVTDNGPGIPKANLSRIFDPFFTTKPVGKGTGLGLSICYGIINKMGGEIEVQSVVDVETTFRVLIPLSRGMKGQKGTSLSKSTPQMTP